MYKYARETHFITFFHIISLFYEIVKTNAKPIFLPRKAKLK